MSPYLHVDLLKHQPDTHQPPSTHKREIMGRLRAARQKRVRDVLGFIRDAAAGHLKQFHRGLLAYDR